MPEDKVAPSFDEDFAKAAADAAAAEPPTDDEGAAPSDTSPSEQPAVEAQTSEATSDELLSAEELAALSEENRAQYKHMQRRWTERTTELAEKRKAIEQQQQLLDSLRSDPENTIRFLATQYGIQLPQAAPQAPSTQSEQPKLDYELTPELEILRPALDKFAQWMESRFEGRVAPVQEVAQKVRAQETEAAISELSRRHPDWQQYEPQMTAKLKLWGNPPAGVSAADFLSDIYRSVAFDARKADQLKQTVDKTNRSIQAAEPESGGVAKDKVTAAAPRGKNFDEDFDAAWAAAQRGEKFI